MAPTYYEQCIIAAGWLKPTKKAILEEAENLARGDDFDDRKLIGLCLKFFKPPLSVQAKKSDVFWVAQACSKDKNRPHLLHPYADCGDFVATDGHRLHILGKYMGETGYHAVSSPDGPKIIHPHDFPPYRKVVPRRSPQSTDEVLVTDFKPFELDAKQKGIKSVISYKSSVFNELHIRQAFARSTAMTLKYFGPLDPIILEDGHLTAVVMPLKLSKEDSKRLEIYKNENR